MDTRDIITEAFGHYDLIPVGKDSKVSLGKWKEKTFEVRELLYHATRGCNIAARVGKTPGGTQVLVIDRDAHDMESWKLLRKHAIAHRCNMATLTASGNSHYWFALEKEMADLRTRIRLAVAGDDDGAEKVAVDVKATGYVLLPGSTIGGRAYEFVEGKGLKRPEDLNPLPASFLEMITKPTSDNKTGGAGNMIDVNTAMVSDTMKSAANNKVISATIDDVRKYVSYIIARCHHGAHNAAFRCAVKIAERVKEFATAMTIFREWNLTNAVDEDGATPYPFSEKELLHKMEDAFRVVSRK